MIWEPTGTLDGFDDSVTEHRVAEAKRSSERTAQAGLTIQSRFLATMSHELRTPLNVVIGFSDAMANDPEALLTREQMAEYAGSINEAGRQLLMLVDVILDVAKIEGGQFELSTDLIEISHLIHTSVTLASASAEQAEVSISGEVWPNLPLLRGDERRLRQALGHLVANAIKFTPGGGSIRVSARLNDPHGDLLILVSDTGIGIAPGDIDRVFEPFLQLESGFSRRFPGSGLGLYVTQITARAHAGELLLRSHVGLGTTAVLRLPAARLIARSRLTPSE